MPPTLTTRTEIPAEVNNFYDKTLLKRAVPLLVHTKFGQVRDIPRKGGTNRIKFRKYTNLAAALTPLSEGITGTGSALAITDIYADVLCYGDYVTITDYVDFSTPDAILTETAMLLGDQAGDTLDQLCRDIITAGTNKYFAGVGHTARIEVAAGEFITTTLFDKAVRLLKLAKIKKMSTMVDAATGYGTAPIPACYLAIIHPSISYTVKKWAGFIPVEKYANKSSVMDGEIGSYGECRLIETTNAKVFTGLGAGAIDVYGTLVFGADAYGVTRISGEAMKNTVKGFGSAGTADPLDQRQTSGWKATFTAKIINQDAIVRLETAAEA